MRFDFGQKIGGTAKNSRPIIMGWLFIFVGYKGVNYDKSRQNE